MNSISDVMRETMEKVREMVDANTVIGDPITTPDGTTLIPVSKIMFGFASGGTDSQKTQNTDGIKFGAAGGAGVAVIPIAFMVINSGRVRMIYIEPPLNSTLDKIADMIPSIIDRFKKKDHEEIE